jgi:hypothetical protein
MNPIIIFLSIVFNSSIAQINEPSDFYLEDKNVSLYAFIGEKISVEEFDPNEKSTRITINPVTKDTIRHVSLITDYAYNVKYKIIKPIFNDLKVDTIEFVAYDHYGRPGFEKNKNVILYISKSEKGDYYVHQKYQYDPVVQNRKGIWKGENGKSIEKLFNTKKEGVFKARGIFK